MFDFRGKFALLSIRSKIITAFLFGCVVVAFAWVIARIVFKETFYTIDIISKPNPKLLVINDLFQKIQRLDYAQKVQVLKIQDKDGAPVIEESNPVILLLDSLQQLCANDTLQTDRIERMKNILYERDELFFNYLKYRYGILRNNPLSKDIHNLSEYIARNLNTNDSNVVRTTRKNTTTTTILDVETPEELSPARPAADKKEPFFRRMFGRKKTKEEPATPVRKLVTENIQETVDTFAITQRDSFMKDMERAITSIEKDRSSRRTRLIDHELKLASASNVFIDELEQLLRQVQSEEIRDLQYNTASLSTVFNKAFNWVEIILCTFLCLILILIFLIFSDISRSNRIKMQLIEAKEKAEFLEQVKHRFLANMSHEIRTPLQAIIGYSELVREQDQPDRQALEAIYRSSGHLLQIVNEVLDYNRIVSGKFLFEKHDFDMQELVAEVADIMEGQAEMKGVTFRLKSDIPGHGLYSGDAFRLKQILFNLLGNAIKFTDHGEVCFSVTARDTGKKRMEFTFEIRDTGIGMSEEELRRVFNSFEQASEKTQKRYGGTGLGLSIAKKLVEMQGGTIRVLSEKNKGSVFTITLPYLKARAGSAEAPAHPPAEAMPVYGKVLVVDDDEFILQLCDAILSRHHIPHVCYSSSEKVLEAGWDETVSLVLLDIRMPGMNGTELFKRLKSVVGTQVKFIALTAQALPDEKNSVFSLGFDRVLLKPFREKELLQVLAAETTGLHHQEYMPEDHFDLSAIRTMCINDEALLQKTLQLLLKEMKTDLAMLTEGDSTGSLEKIANASHKLASKTGQVGLHLLAGQLRAIERKARDGESLKDLQISAIVKQLENIIGKIEAQIIVV